MSMPRYAQFTAEDYKAIYSEVFSGAYPGYKADILESPHGDGNLDLGKRYAHVNIQYFRQYRYNPVGLLTHLCRAHALAMKVATALGVPAPFLPSFEHSTLRIIEYSPGAISHPHTDMDLFTLMLYRDQPEHFHMDRDAPKAASRLNDQVHLGEIAEMLGLGKAQKHWVSPSGTVQRSIVYFAIPNHEETLSTGKSVGDWLTKRLARSRKKVEKPSASTS
jgi:hypothetical protein